MPGFFGAQKKALKQLDRYKDFDSLTGLRREKLLHLDFAGLKNKAGYALVYMKLENFFQLNTLFNHEAGAAALEKISIQLRHFLRKHEGSGYRIGLDQFVLLCPAFEQEQFTEAVLDLIGELNRIYVQDHQIVYSYKYQLNHVLYFLVQEDNALDDISPLLKLLSFESEKAAGREMGVHTLIFDTENRPDWQIQRVLDRDLEKAWEARQFVPYYQMVYDLESKKPIGAELLTRWAHPERGLIFPNAFLPAMEEKGLIMDLDLYMLEEACKHIKKWIDDELISVPLSINISKLNLHRENFAKRVIETVKKYDIPPVLIELEITEGILLFEKNKEFVEITNALHNAGFTITMDNFAATDFSSVNLLRDLPVDAVKISPRFFEGYSGGGKNKIFVDHILRMLKELQIKVVVTGVETEAEVSFFHSLHCDMGQGYYFSKPISNEEFEKQIF